jgi:hypothetical protein
MEAVVIPALVGLSLTAYLVKKFGTVDETDNKLVS